MDGVRNESASQAGGANGTDLHKLFVVYLNPSVSVGVDAVIKIHPVNNKQKSERQIDLRLESFRQGLDYNTSPHETVKSDTGRWAITRRRRSRGYTSENKYLSLIQEKAHDVVLTIFLFDHGQ